MTIVTERTFVYTAEAVFWGWVAEETLVAPVTKIEKDVRIGGHYRLFVEIENTTAVMEAVYRVIEPNRKLVYSWEWKPTARLRAGEMEVAGVGQLGHVAGDDAVIGQGRAERVQHLHMLALKRRQLGM